MMTGDYTFEYGTFRVKLWTTRVMPYMLNWYAQKREPNTFELWAMEMAWEVNAPDGVLVVVDEVSL